MFAPSLAAFSPKGEFSARFLDGLESGIQVGGRGDEVLDDVHTGRRALASSVWQALTLLGPSPVASESRRALLPGLLLSGVAVAMLAVLALARFVDSPETRQGLRVRLRCGLAC